MRKLVAGVIGVVCMCLAAVPAGAVARAPHKPLHLRSHSSQSAGLQAVIRRTAYGIPHIESNTLAGAGYGYGYAFAEDDICTMAADYVTVDAQRSKWFGPNGSYEQRGNSTTPNNLNSDFYWQSIIDSGTVEKLLPVLEPDAREVVQGYVEGYNRYLAHVGGSAGVPDPTCRGKGWVHPIDLATAYRRFYQLVELASGDVVIDGTATAQPPTPSLPVGSLPLPNLPLPLSARSRAARSRAVRARAARSRAARARATRARARTAKPLPPAVAARRLARRLPIKGAGSNAVAIGHDGTRDHTHGLLLGNPHFPWDGDERFYQAQLTVPGKINVSGVGLYGVPAVLIGYTSTMAWSHTVSTAYRFTPYALTLVPGSPTTFLRDGKPVGMTAQKVTVQVPDGSGRHNADGSPTTKPATRTLYSAPGYGRIFNALAGVPFPWTPTTAYAMRDANASNFRVFNHFFDVDRAHSSEEVLKILKRWQGIPWVNTIASDKQGHALYADIGAVPNVPDAKAKQCDTPLGVATFQLLRLPVLDGSRSACDWDNDPDAAAPGLFGPSHMPYLFRSDYVTNSNDSYWLANPHHPLTGFARIIGDENTARSLRTRIGLIMTQARVDGSDHLGPPGFTRQDMQNMVFSDRQYGGELVRDQLVAMCRSMGGVAPSTSSGVVSLGNACNVLAAWDLHENLDSKGAVLFRRFWDRALGAPVAPFSNPFNAADPVNTPNGLNTASPLVRAALGDAVKDLEGAHIPLDAAPGQVQFATRNAEKIPLHGGPGDPNGDFNAIYTEFTPGKGFSDPDLGSSYVQVVTWHDGFCPDARTILTYSQSANPDSPFYADQTRLYSRKKWVTGLFCRADVLRGTLSTTTLRGSAVTTTTRKPPSAHKHKPKRAKRKLPRGYRRPARRPTPRFTG